MTPTFVRQVLASPAFKDSVDPSVFWDASLTQRNGVAAHNALWAPALSSLAVVAAPNGLVIADGDLARASSGTILAVRAGSPALVEGRARAPTWSGRVLERHGGIWDETEGV